MGYPTAKPKPRHPNVEAALQGANDADTHAICPCGRGKPALSTGRCTSCAAALAAKTRKALAANPPPERGTWRHDIKLVDQVEEWDCGVCSEGGKPVWHQANETVCTEGPVPVYRPLVCSEHLQRKALSTGRCDSCAHALAYANRATKGDDGEQLKLEANAEGEAASSPTRRERWVSGEILDENLLREFSFCVDGQRQAVVLVEGQRDGLILVKTESSGGWFAGHHIPQGWAAAGRIASPPADGVPVLHLSAASCCAECGLPSIHHVADEEDFLEVPGLQAELVAVRTCNALIEAENQKLDQQDRERAALESLRRTNLDIQFQQDEEEVLKTLRKKSQRTVGQLQAAQYSLGFHEVPERYSAHGRETIDSIRDECAYVVSRLRSQGLLDGLLGDDEALGDLVFAVGFCGGNARKYVEREGLKGDDDSEKARWYRAAALHVFSGFPDPREARVREFEPYSRKVGAPHRMWSRELTRIPQAPFCRATGCEGRLGRVEGEDQAEALGLSPHVAHVVCSDCGQTWRLDDLSLLDRAGLGVATSAATKDGGFLCVEDDFVDILERIERLVQDPVGRAALEAGFGRAS